MVSLGFHFSEMSESVTAVRLIVMSGGHSHCRAGIKRTSRAGQSAAARESLANFESSSTAVCLQSFRFSGRRSYSARANLHHGTKELSAGGRPWGSSFLAVGSRFAQCTILPP
jgi:hypothetical protein